MRSLIDYLPLISGKTVLVRCNFDVPIKNDQVVDATRIEDCSETLRLLLEDGCRLVLLAHNGRPDGWEEDKSLAPVIDVLAPLLGEDVNFCQDFKQVKSSQTRVTLVENLRFWPGEEANDPEFVKQLAELGDYYVNEAFANCHRKHASIVGLAKALPAVAGVRLNQEITVLTKVKNHPEKPLVVVIGGAKLETKEPLVWSFKDSADTILVGGKVAVDLRGKSHLPDNVVLAQSTDNLKDITTESAEKFAEIIMAAKTVVWNGTMGVFEEPENATGTEVVARAMNQTPAFTVIGGGDTETALTQMELETGIDHISSGGGAMLEFLVAGTLPGIEVLGHEQQD